MKPGTRRAVVVGVILVVGGAVGYEILTSTAPGEPCAGISSGTGNPSAVLSPAVATPSQTRAVGPRSPFAGQTDGVGTVIPVVAAENFWGSLVAQLGGNLTAVTSIVSDPNTDPHEYEANASVSRALAGAQYVIVNGVGYDDWALSILNASGTAGQVVLNVGELNGVGVGGGIVGGNPHLWYNPAYVNRTVAAMYTDLVSLEPGATPEFEANYATLNASLASVYAQATQIREQFAGTEVASTESVFVYLANYAQLDLVSPPDFMEAVSEGNDPPATSVVDFQCQLESGGVHVLVYNEQTVTPITTQMESLATAHHVPLVGVTETIQPPNATFQAWMGGELLLLEQALSASSPSR